MNLKGPWWLGAIVGLVIAIVGIVFGKVPLVGAGGLVLVISGGRAVLGR